MRSIFSAVILVLTAGAASAQPLSLAPPANLSGDEETAQPPSYVMPQRTASAQHHLGGGFIEFLFGGQRQQAMSTPPHDVYLPREHSLANRPIYANTAPADDQTVEQQPPERRMDPRYLPQDVDYATKEAPGTIVIDTPNHFLYLVGEGGKATRYGIGVGRPGFTWSGVHAVSSKKEWPDWVPPKEMIARQPYLPHFMPGGPNNPLGARAMYLGSTLYRIHGSNEPWTIGQNVSSGCIRMRNVDVIDLYGRVNVGAKVIVL